MTVDAETELELRAQRGVRGKCGDRLGLGIAGRIIQGHPGGAAAVHVHAAGFSL